ncbi:MAG: hypothetical protein FWE03_06990 [Firmicutes bacterium]|nr:hypothetical protein [Bacillota bacterium]
MKFIKDTTDKMLKLNNIRLSDEAKAVYDQLYAHYDGIEIILLREIGFSVGLKSATTYSKKELVNAVALMQASNLVKIELTDKKRGEVSNEEVLKLIDSYKNRDYVVNSKNVAGLVVVNETSAWLRPNLIEDDNADIFVPMRVEGKARVLEQANRLGLFNILTINDIEIGEFDRKSVPAKIDKNDLLMSFDGLDKINDLSQKSPFYKGEIKLIISNDMPFELMESFRKQRVYPIGLMLDADRSKKSGQEDYRIFELDLLKTLKIDQNIHLIVSNAFRMLESKKDCVIIVDNADSLSKESIAKLVSACGVYQEGSISLVMFVKVIAMTDKVNWMARVAGSIAN